MLEQRSEPWPLESWPVPPVLPRIEYRPHVWVCPFVGLNVPEYGNQDDLFHAWFTVDPHSWKMKPFRRRALWARIRRNWNVWYDWLRVDSTPTFFVEATISGKRQGVVIGIRGPKWSGKSVLEAIVLTHLVDTTPHIIFRHRDAKKHIEQYLVPGSSLGLGIDEDLRATGENSKNLMVLMNNAFETSRKAALTAITTGVNVNFEGWQDTLDLRLEPWGFNERFQATRFAFFSAEDDLLGLAALQRKFRPDDPVMYYGDEGTWGQYIARATAYSYTVLKQGGGEDAIDDITQDEHIAAMKKYLRENYVDKGKDIPSEIKCRRLYRKAKLPAGVTIGYMTEIIQWAIDELDDDDTPEEKAPSVELTAEGWQPLRRALEKLTKDPAFALWAVPDWPKMNYTDISTKLTPELLPDSLGKRLRHIRLRLTPKQLGDLGEQLVASWLESCHARWGGGGSGTPDVLVTLEDQETHQQVETALNVKCSLREQYAENLEVTPECDWPHSAVVLLLPRLLEVRLYPITGRVMTLNSSGGRLAKPDTLAAELAIMVTQSTHKTEGDRR